MTDLVRHLRESRSLGREPQEDVVHEVAHDGWNMERTRGDTDQRGRELSRARKEGGGAAHPSTSWTCLAQEI